MQITVDASELLRWARHLDEVPKITKTGVSRALNQFGDSVARTMAIDVAQQTGMPIHQVGALFSINRATPGNLFWELDASRALGGEAPAAGGRRLPSRTWEKKQGGEFISALVNVITAGDEWVCDKCEEIAENGPYTIEVARALIPHHPNCRCAVEAFRPTRRMGVKFTTRFGPAPRGGGMQQFSTEQLSQIILSAAESAVSIAVGKL